MMSGTDEVSNGVLCPSQTAVFCPGLTHSASKLAAMTIRYSCDKCGSVLKIKDELAGTDGKCPKCKTRFVVPNPAPEGEAEAPVAASRPQAKVAASPPAPPKPVVAESTSSDSIPAAKAQTKSTPKAVEKPAAKSSAKAADDDEFDPVSFLMEGPRKKPTFEPELDDEDAPPARSKSGASGARGGGGRGFSLDDDMDEDFDSPPPPTRKWGAKNDSSGSADRSTGNSRSVAQDLLTRSMEESRVRASEMPEAQSRFSFDFAGFFREIGLKSVGMILGIMVLAYGVYWSVDRMVGVKVKIPPLGFVSGTVLVKDKPASGIRVYLSPLEREIPGANGKKERARDSIGVTDEQGNFVLYYLPDLAGVKVGPCKLWMESLNPDIPIPPKYGMGSVHQLEVKSGPNEHQTIKL